MSDWQPISTAPKDSERLIGWDGSNVTLMIRFASSWYDLDMDNPGTFAPTHWMPLPNPPEGT